MSRITGEEATTSAPTTRITETPGIQGHWNPCPASDKGSFQFEPALRADLGYWFCIQSYNTRGSLTPTCSNILRITGEATISTPTPGVTGWPSIQEVKGIGSFWSKSACTLSRLGLQPLHPLLQHPEKTRLPGAPKCPES